VIFKRAKPLGKENFPCNSKSFRLSLGVVKLAKSRVPKKNLTRVIRGFKAHNPISRPFVIAWRNENDERLVQFCNNKNSLHHKLLLVARHRTKQNQRFQNGDRSD